MIRRRHRINFRLTDDQHRKYEAMLRAPRHGRHYWSWTDMCIVALDELWKAVGSPEPAPPAERMTAGPAVIQDLFTKKKRPRSAPTSAPTRPTTSRRKKR